MPRKTVDECDARIRRTFDRNWRKYGATEAVARVIRHAACWEVAADVLDHRMQGLMGKAESG